jgi:predicted outer membrane repeat protein
MYTFFEDAVERSRYWTFIRLRREIATHNSSFIPTRHSSFGMRARGRGIRPSVISNCCINIVMAWALIAVEPVSADSLSVCASGCQFMTISDALAAASRNDTIQIGPGRYAENIIIAQQGITLIGAGVGQTQIEGGGLVVRIYDDRVATIKDLSIYNGSIGGIFIGYNANVTIQNSVLVGNHGFGGVYNQGTLTVQNSIVAGNTHTSDYGDGGGIYSCGDDGALTIQESTIIGNTAADQGGGIYICLGTLTLQDSYVYDNRAAGDGGGISNYLATVTVKDSVISGNSAQGNGGGIFSSIENTEFPLTIKNATISGNSAKNGGGIYNSSGTNVTLKNTTVNGNDPNDCVGC